VAQSWAISNWIVPSRFDETLTQRMPASALSWRLNRAMLAKLTVPRATASVVMRAVPRARSAPAVTRRGEWTAGAWPATA
jgi:hypothetical protein